MIKTVLGMYCSSTRACTLNIFSTKKQSDNIIHCHQFNVKFNNIYRKKYTATIFYHEASVPAIKSELRI